MKKNTLLMAGKKMGRRDFLKLSAATATVLGMSQLLVPQICEALEKNEKPAVIWLHFQECTGCTESLLRASEPDIAELILDIISLEYHETLFAASGHQIEQNLTDAIKRYSGKYVLVVEGSIPTKNNGNFCRVGGHTAIDILHKTAQYAAAIIAIGSCASWGGIPSAGSNPTGAQGVSKTLDDLHIKKPVINIPGCPPNPHNFLSTVVHFLMYGLPKLDAQNRPTFAYGTLIHDQCERRSHFDSGRFAEEFGDEGHRKGYCLYKLGCKGPSTFGNCPEQGFNAEKKWPVSIGHPCFGCIEQGVGFTQPLHALSEIREPTPPQVYAKPIDPKSKTIGPLATGIAGFATGAVAMTVINKSKSRGRIKDENYEEQ
jgi:hydrogenase small subunit